MIEWNFVVYGSLEASRELGAIPIEFECLLGSKMEWEETFGFILSSLLYIYCLDTT
jgi:hypothetical protein